MTLFCKVQVTGVVAVLKNAKVSDVAPLGNAIVLIAAPTTMVTGASTGQLGATPLPLTLHSAIQRQDVGRF